MVNPSVQVGNDTLNWVWISDKDEVFKKGYVLETVDDDKVKVRLEDGSDFTVLSASVEQVNPAKFDKADDIGDLTFLNEASVLHNLDMRYKDDLIHTYSGLFLVTINPYTKLPIYSDDYVNMYHGVPKADTKPHIFAETEEAYQNLIKEKRDQSILVTGESGAGKTENTKKIIQYLAAITSKQGGTKSFEQQIIQANPILEAFGNSQTVWNNNSSRFGKFIKIEFDQNGKIAGAHIDWYLLEKSRVVRQAKKERNYHVFYQLLAGLTEEDLHSFGLERSPTNYIYLKESNFTIPGIDDKREFQNLKEALDIMGIEKCVYNEIFKLLAAILLVGNIEFVSLKAEQASFKSSVSKLSELLGVSNKDFSDSILNPKVKAGRELIKQSRNASQARFALDALSKSLYEKVFKFLVDSINKKLDHSSAGQNFIGVLDIAGFEIFRENSFEQLCINYTNEKLQHFFNHHMFVLEQNEYMKEEIDWKFIDFGHDLQQTIDLIEKQKPIGILSILEEECIVPKSSDNSFFEKLNQFCNKKSEKFKPSKFANKFTLKHYAGDVEYSTDGWIEKNRDPLADNVIEILSQSTNKFLSEIYSEQSSKVVSSHKTVSQRHKEQLNDLLKSLSQTHPHFVRCIIPNHKKQPQLFDKKLVLNQLKCNGVLEGIRIVRSGFPNRIFLREFYQRYNVLAPNLSYVTNMKTNCQLILSNLRLDSESYKVGSTKVFFKAGILAELEIKRDTEIKSALTSFKAVAKGILKRRAINRKLEKIQASQVLVNAIRTYNNLTEDPWFNLYSCLKPLLESSQQVLKSKKMSEKVKLLEQQVEELELKNSDISKKHFIASEDLVKVGALLESEKLSLKQRDTELEKSKIKEKELEAQLSKASDNLVDLQAQYRTTQKAESELQEKLRGNETKIISLEEEKSLLSNQVLEFKRTTKELEEYKKNKDDALKSIEQELAPLKKLNRTKDTQIKELQDKISTSDKEVGDKINSLNSSYSRASTRVSELLEENKELNGQINSLQEINHGIESSLAKNQKDQEILKEHLRKQASEIRAITKECETLKSEQLKISKDSKTDKDEISQLKSKHKQLEKQAYEAKQLLQQKISDDVAFHRGKQKYDSDLVNLKNQIQILTSDLNEERSKTHLLTGQVRDLKLENEIFEKERKFEGVTSATGAFRTRSIIVDSDSATIGSRDESAQLRQENASIRLVMNEQAAFIKREKIAKQKVETDLKFIRHRLASEAFDKQQLQLQLSKIKQSLIKGETPDLSDDVLSKLKGEIDSLKFDLELERKASKRSQEQNEELQKRVLEEKNVFSPSSVSSGNLKSNNFRAKYEESQAKIRLLERQLSESSNSSVDSIFSNNNLAQRGDSTVSQHHEGQLLEVYQETSRNLNSVRDELFKATSKVAILTRELGQANKVIEQYKDKDVEALSNQLAREELAKVHLKVDTLESKNEDLSKSVQLYRSRAKEYFDKLEEAGNAIRTSKYAEKLSKEQLIDATSTIETLKKDLKSNEADVLKLHLTINQSKEQLETKDAELYKAKSVEKLLKEEIQHYHERLMNSSSYERSKIESQLNKMEDDLNASLRTETNLRTTIGALEVKLEGTKSSMKNQVSELTKEKSYYMKLANDLKEDNDAKVKSQDSLKVKLKSLMAQIGQLNGSVDALITERDALYNDKRRLESQLTEITGEYKKFEDDKDIVSRSEENMKVTIDKYEARIDDLVKEKKQLKFSHEQLQETFDEEKQKIVILTEENHSLGKFIKSLQHRIGEFEEKAKVNQDKTWIDRLGKVEQKLEEEVHARIESEKFNKVLNRSISQLNTQIETQQRDLLKFEEERSKYEMKITELYNAIQKWQSVDSTSRLTIKRAEREIRHLQENSLQLEKELNQWKQKFDMISTRRSNLPQDEVFI